MGRKYQYTCEVGDVVKYHGKVYVITDIEIVMCGHSKVVTMVKGYTDSLPLLKICKRLYDCEINALEKIKD
jgi:hypothetical protein